MTEATTAPAPGPAAKAVAVVDLGLRACEAYDRPDAAARLAAARRALADPVLHIVVAGEFKQGKSSLVNALVGATVCPVDDDVATAVPTYVRHGAQPEASLLVEAETPRREAIAMADVRRYVVEGDAGEQEVAADGARVTGVEVRLPRKILPAGWSWWTRPAWAASASPHAAASLAAISMADAVLFVTGAAQELTRSEVDFLRRARSLCPVVACVITKTDFYPAWRRIQELNEQHLAAHCPVPLMSVSSPLRSRAVKANDTGLNAESGYSQLVKFLTDQIGRSAADRLADDAAAEVAALCDQLEAHFDAERAALADPEAAQRVVRELTAVKAHVDALKTAAAKWNQTLNDGVTDLTSDVDHDLRARVARGDRRGGPRDRGGRPGRHLAGDGALAAVPAGQRTAGQLRAAAQPGEPAERSGRPPFPRGRRARCSAGRRCTTPPRSPPSPSSSTRSTCSGCGSPSRPWSR